MLENIKGVIFDLDGTLIDSMWIWEKIDLEFIKLKSLNISSQQIMNDLAPLTFDESALYFINNFNLKESTKEITDIWMTMAIKEYENNVFLKKGAYDFLIYLKNKNVKIALATSSDERLLCKALEKNNIKSFFNYIVTTDMVGLSKDNPDFYLLLADNLNINPDNLAVFEDIPQAMAAAKKAGMKVFAIYDSYSKHLKNDILLNSDFYLNDFSEVKIK
ncbi:MAG: HAD family hydrolase [Clostridium sp.]|nr:HAD family hydrolase [Clostridium sp.]